MKKKINFTVLILSALVIGSSWLAGFSSHTIDFSTEVKPVINAKCISCHGGVKAKGGFSLLFREEALAKTESGVPAIIPGDADNSELIRRISQKDPAERFRWLTAAKSTILQCSKVHPGLSAEPEGLLDDLFGKYVE